MTREKSIFAMEYYKLHYALTTEAVEAFDMAIEALEHKPCDDCISRQMLKAKMFDLPKPPSNKTYWDGVDDVGNLIDKLPPVKPEPSISEDGTLTVNVEDGNKVSRVLVCGDNHFGGLYYPEQEPCKVGHWISNAEDDLKISEYTCSNCKGLSDEDSDFCPKCGSYNGGAE